ncbi:hypothetical protein ARMA_2290 [Ardenticatena maritima]|uniref:Uncharacterized protein n=1 Tax=Ardenticatena maritima TaxID=872965 RepID=A0A0M9UDE1_9CHLR|nr:hypothetical protein ARMA_2290 [Ardenticatena maritima]
MFGSGWTVAGYSFVPIGRALSVWIVREGCPRCGGLSRGGGRSTFL